MAKKNILFASLEYKGEIYKECIIRENDFYRLNTKKGVVLADSRDCKILESKIIGKTNK